ncbi:MAG: hypothetical protein L6R28_24315 [Planctomycetes bacterium]|nr:hypothetical protein [Planctomycetota bacterium]
MAHRTAVFLFLLTVCLLVLYAGGAGRAHASALEDAQALQKEANQLLRQASQGETDAKVYAQAVFKLQKAEQLLEQAGGGAAVEQMQSEIAAAIFWARRFANINVIHELEKGDTGGGTTPSTKPDSGKPADQPKEPAPEPAKPAEPAKPPETPAPPPPPPPPPPPEPAKPADTKPVDEKSAEAAYKSAEAFEGAHKDDDHLVAMRWFQVAEGFPGSEWSLRALAKAREAQARVKAKLDAEKMATMSPDEKLIAEGDVLLNQKKYLEALRKYQDSQNLKNTTLAARRIGDTYLQVGFNLRDDFTPKYLELMRRFNEARSRGQAAVANGYAQQARNLNATLGKDVLHNYNQAMKSYEKGLSIAVGSDLICELQIGILNYWMKRPGPAKSTITRALEKYQPKNDEERTVMESARTLLPRIR